MGRNLTKGDGETATLDATLAALVREVRVSACRLLLETPHVEASVPMLRGVWGRALHHLDRDLYNRLFIGEGPAHNRIPLYLMRPAPPDAETAPALDLIAFNISSEDAGGLVRAWDVAQGMGVGKSRTPFRVRGLMPLTHEGVGYETDKIALPNSWPLSIAQYPDYGKSGCRLTYTSPLRLMSRGYLIEEPSLVDIAAAAFRRLYSLGKANKNWGYRDTAQAVHAAAVEIPSAPWNGDRIEFVRWSGSQDREINLHGVTGSIDLPAGLGPLACLMGATAWTHIGKGTVFGLGGVVITPLT